MYNHYNHVGHFGRVQHNICKPILQSGGESDVAKQFGVVCWSLSAARAAGLVEKPEDYVRYAKEIGFDGVALDTPVLPPPDDEDANRGLKEIADRLSMFVDVGTTLDLEKAMLHGNADALFRRARLFGAPVLKSVLQNCGVRFAEHWDAAAAEECVRRKIDVLRGIGEVAEKHELPVAFENHIDFRNDEIVRIFEAVPSPYVGLLLDTANQLGLMQEPAELCRSLADRILATHFKDGYPVDTPDGVNLVWCPPGEGVAGVADMAPVLQDERYPHINLELIVNQAWPVPYKTAAFWSDLGAPRPSAAGLVARIEAGKEGRVPPPDRDPEALAAHERQQLTAGLAALKALFN